jgi:glucokinase
MSLATLFPRLLGDVGGTNARFGWQAAHGQPLQNIRVLACSDHAGIDLAIASYLKTSGLDRPRAACIGIACPVTGDKVRMTNHHWAFSVQALQEQLGLEVLRVLNDFTALALSLPDLPPESKRQVGGPDRGDDQCPIALIGPGTGLGVSGLLPCQGQWLPIAGEGGHVTLAARRPLEFEALQVLQRRFGHASAERVLSGQGLEDLHAALGSVQGQAAHTALDAASITHRALHDADAQCLQTLEMFACFLGRVAGDLALTLGARGGLYIGGGIVPRLLGWFEQSDFRREFEDKGRYATYLAEVPVWVIQTEHSPALWGAARALDQLR